MTRRGGRLTALATALLVACLVLPAAALGSVEDESPVLQVRIEQLLLEPDGRTRMTVAVSGLPEGEQIGLEQLEVVEDGEPVDGLELTDTTASEEAAIVPAVVVAMDVSGSTEGEPLEAATAAAVDLLGTVAEGGARVGVVSFGESTQILAPLADDAAGAIDAVSGLEAGGETSLYDGVSRAARMLAGHDGPRDIIVFSDGEDTVSQSSLDDVLLLLAQTEVRVTSVLLQSGEVSVGPLEAMAGASGGRLIAVEGAGDLGAAFEAVAGDLTNRLEVTWVAEPVPDPPRTLNIVATYSTDAVTASDGRQVMSPRLAEITPPRAVDVPGPIVPFLAGPQGQLVAAITAGVAVLLLLWLLLVSGGIRQRRGRLQERLSAYQATVADRGREDRVSLTDRASTAFEALPLPTALDSRVARAIEHADWPMRVSEFLLVSLGLGLLGFLVGAVVLASGLAGIVGLLLGLAGPWVYLQVAISRRRSAFSEQLPNVLQILAGALRAGHGLSTALEGAVSEVDDPARSELRRASVEARLGRPLDRALDGVAKRMKSEDLQWVIGAIEVQREVGGNLAEILGNVAQTLRDRASVARHVKSLTAEGRLSAIFIASMPFVMFVALNVMNPEYMQLLYERTLGRLMLAAGAVLMVAGIVVLRRLVRPRY